MQDELITVQVGNIILATGYDALWYPVCYACGYLFLLLFIWFAILLAIISLRTGKHFVTAAAIVKLAVAVFPAVSVAVTVLLPVAVSEPEPKA